MTAVNTEIYMLEISAPRRISTDVIGRKNMKGEEEKKRKGEGKTERAKVTYRGN
jgi:hypothetical protein